MPFKSKVKEGDIYGYLTVIERDYSKKGKRYYKCKCKCGKEIVRRASSLNNKIMRSCGCYVHNKTHGMTNNGGTKPVAPEYSAWQNMRRRCQDPKTNTYKHYGGRGMKVCDKWDNSFEEFLKDVGPKPTPKHSIDRINNDGDYEPGNVKWSTQVEQTRNRRSLVNTSGCKGVFWNKTKQKWEVRIGIGGKEVFIGTFRNYQQAVEARKRAEKELW